MLAEHLTAEEDAANKVERQVGTSAAALLLESRIGEQFDAINGEPRHILNDQQESLLKDERAILNNLRVALMQFGATPPDNETLSYDKTREAEAIADECE